MSHLGPRLSALVDNELSPAERDRVLAHLARCEPCRAEAMALRALKQRLHTLGDAAAGTDLIRRLLAMPPPPGYPQPPPRSGRRRAALAAVASSLVVAGLAAAAFAAGGGSPQPAPTVTPAVDVFMVQHAVTSGTAPRPPSPAPASRSSVPGEP